MTPALLTRMCSGRFQSAAHGILVGQVQGARRDLVAGGFGDVGGDLPGCLGGRTARTTSAPAKARTRVVSVPMPEPAPVTIARLPERSTPSITSEAVE
jgi:hypothetical protein